jgi:hypothetical protein
MLNSNYQIIVAGFTFDLALMTMYPPTSCWANKARPTPDQQSVVSIATMSTLDRLTSFALAGSKARATPLKHLWQELGLSSSDPDRFRAIWQSAEVFLPFDRSGIAHADLDTSQIDLKASNRADVLA